MGTRNLVILGHTLLFFWRLLGCLATPVLLLMPATRRRILKVPAPAPGQIWIHGASLGEHRAIEGLESEIGRENWRTFSSFRTPIPRAWPAPLDLPFFFKRWLDRARPSMLILIEAELWPGWIYHAHKRGIPIICCNARPGKTEQRYKKVGLWNWVQDRVKFIHQKETGDLKSTTPLGEPPFRLKGNWLIAASVRESDEEALLSACIGLKDNCNFVIAPRRLIRIEFWKKKLTEEGLAFQLRSQLSGDPIGPILLLDSIGELKDLFSMGRAAFVGGCFDPTIGGHSPAEATRGGLPVVGGPYRQANPQSWKEAIAIDCKTPDQLETALLQAIRTPKNKGKESPSAKHTKAKMPEPYCPPESAARPLLWPLRGIYQNIGKRQKNYCAAAISVDLPVVSIGGIAMGGSGKTPICDWIGRQFPNSTIIGRGYGRTAKGPDIRLTDNLGDELEMLRKRGRKVISAPNRVAAAKVAKNTGARLIILDDGFQHRRIARDIDVVAIDSRWPTARGLFPVGWGRETWSSLHRADFIWLHNYSPRLPIPQCIKPIIKSWVRPVAWRHQGDRLPLEALHGDVHVACGIANPSGFLSTLSGLNLTPKSWRLQRDHTPLTNLIKGTVITEKDAARLDDDRDFWVLETELTVRGAEDLLGAIEGLL